MKYLGILVSLSVSSGLFASSLGDQYGSHYQNEWDCDAALEQREAFKSEKIRLASVKSDPSYRSAVVATELGQVYGGFLPKAVVIMDYPESARTQIEESTLVVKFPSAFEERLPPAIQDELRERHLLGKARVDIFLNVQANTYLGEREDHRDGFSGTTRIKAHAWMDPNAPAQFAGTRINRDILLGIYDADTAIEDEVKVGSLQSFNVHIHDSVFSPRNARIRLASGTPSQAFWTLVIDEHHDTQGIRAVVTLHWILTGRDDLALKKLLFKSEQHSVYGIRLPKYPLELGLDSFGEFLKEVSHFSSFADSPMVKKLQTLFQ